MNAIRLLETFWQDLRHGGRVLRLNPGFATVAVVSLALGVGANTAIFQLLDTLRLRMLPVKEPRELVEIQIAERKGASGAFMGRRPNLTNPLWERIREQQEAFSGTLAWGTTTFDLAEGGEARYAQALWVSGAFFQTLGVAPAAGRLFTAHDDRRGCGAPGVVISHPFWQREFGGERSAVGRTLRLDGHPFEVVGVTAPGFFGVDVGRQFDVAVPICAEAIINGSRTTLDERNVWFLAALGRLKPGWSAERAAAHLASISPGIFQDTVSPKYSVEDANTYTRFRLTASPAGAGISTLRRTYETPLWVLLATTGLVLLIACANLANLMLARATAREREMAVRLAVGASRGRIVRQLLAESLLLAALGAAAGAVLARWLSGSLVAFLSSDTNRLFLDLRLDWRVFGFAAALAVLTCVLFGLAPALRAARIAPGAAMKAGGRGLTDAREPFGLRRGLVVAQVALSLVLVVGALLFVGSLHNLMRLDAGFRQEGILVANFDVRRAGIAEERRPAAYQEIADRLAALPQVESAAQVYILPVSGSGWNNVILVDGAVQKDYPNFNRVSPGYFRTMGTRILAGRDFDRRDTAVSPPVAVVNESFARTFLPGRDPLGRTFQIQEPPGAPQPQYEVVGVVQDTKYSDLRQPFGPIAHLAAAQEKKPDAFLQVVIRSDAPLATVTSAVARVAGDVHPRISLQFDTMASQVSRTLLPERLMATLTGFFGVLAGLIATIGLYGVLSYMVARRRNEIGIRMALGAGRAAVVRLVMRDAGVLVAAGVLTGVLLSVLAARTASALLFGLAPGDPATLAKAVAGLVAVAALASYLPAERAARVEPTVALRDE